LAITTGSRLGSYEIVGVLGAGGMGEVYRAHDTKLNRAVAIKVLPDAYASDPERVARFHREAQAVAALNHPRVAAIYDFAETDGVKFLVLELVEGETLADRLRRGAMPVDGAIATGVQILEALEAAHEQGICHRDLKPANIKLTEDGAVKVLDFGLAKFVESSASAPSLTQSPTLSVAGTIPGVILGTAGYMSPEQAKGYRADQRSDIFSFGCILYEMLTGRQAFDGESVSEILAGIIKSDVDLALLPPRLNPRLSELLRRCLEKNPKKRWHAAADVRVELEAVAANALQAPAPPVGVRSGRRALAWIASVLVAIVTGAALGWFLKTTPAPQVSRFQLMVPEGQVFTNTGRHVVTVSPDGTSFVYVANGRLFLRSLSSIEAQPIAGAESTQSGGIVNPVFAPDGSSIAYFSTADAAIKRISTQGGASSIVCAAANPLGMYWGGDHIVFGGREGILRVAAKGGQPELIVPTPPDHVLSQPQLLPDGKTILYSMKGINGSWDKGTIVVQPIGGTPKPIITDGSSGRYLPTGHIVYGVGGVLMAAPFDLAKLEVTGAAVPVAEGVRRVGMDQTGTGAAQFAFSETGTLVYLPGPIALSTAGGFLSLYDQHGAATRLNLPQGVYNAPRVSPDGRMVAFDSDNGTESNVWVYELSGKTAARQLTLGGKNRHVVWSPDGQWLLFQSDRDGDQAIFRQRADGAGAAERLTKPTDRDAHSPQSYSPDGKFLIFTVQRESKSQLYVMTMVDRTTTAIEQTDSIEGYTEGALSPDGRWLAFQRRESPASVRHVFLQPFPSTKARYLIRSRIAGQPYWSPDGKQLTLNVGPGVSEIVPVITKPSVQFGPPREIVRTNRSEPNPLNTRRNVDPLPDGEHLVGVSLATAVSDDLHMTVVLNWFDEVRRRAPAR
jgi:eukaryotic-like serine/threonine-protein kinase